MRGELLVCVLLFQAASGAPPAEAVAAESLTFSGAYKSIAGFFKNKFGSAEMEAAAAALSVHPPSIKEPVVVEPRPIEVTPQKETAQNVISEGLEASNGIRIPESALNGRGADGVSLRVQLLEESKERATVNEQPKAENSEQGKVTPGKDSNSQPVGDSQKQPSPDTPTKDEKSPLEVPRHKSTRLANYVYIAGGLRLMYSLVQEHVSIAVSGSLSKTISYASTTTSIGIVLDPCEIATLQGIPGKYITSASMACDWQNMTARSITALGEATPVTLIMAETSSTLDQSA